jgi:hypothetical protein
MKKLVLPLLCVVSILFSTGCASVMSGTTQTITIKTKPAGAKATFFDNKGEAISVQNTPCTVPLKRSGHYTLKIEKDDYAPLELEMKRTVNGWYFGNVIFGGLLGLAIVDPATGAMFTFSPSTIDARLALTSSGMPSEIIKPAYHRISSDGKPDASRR